MNDLSPQHPTRIGDLLYQIWALTADVLDLLTERPRAYIRGRQGTAFLANIFWLTFTLAAAAMILIGRQERIVAIRKLLAKHGQGHVPENLVPHSMPLEVLGALMFCVIGVVVVVVFLQVVREEFFPADGTESGLEIPLGEFDIFNDRDWDFDLATDWDLDTVLDPRFDPAPVAAVSQARA